MGLPSGLPRDHPVAPELERIFAYITTAPDFEALTDLDVALNRASDAAVLRASELLHQEREVTP